MSPLDIVALVSPIVPVTLTALVLRAHWWRGLIAPAEFSVVVAQGGLAAAARMPAAEVAAGVGFVIAVAGLVALVYRDEWYAHRAATAVFRWEQFASDFRAYLTTHPPDPGGSFRP